MRPMRPTGAIKAPKRWSWDEADAEAVANNICAACLVSFDSRIRATHRIDAECGCGRHSTAFCASCTQQFATALESTCGTCGQDRRFSEPLRIGYGAAQALDRETKQSKEPDKSYLGEEADEWLA